ncbi:MAG: hypothetical protein AB7E37_05450 [Candidatus Altimarinota bacterium]
MSLTNLDKSSHLETSQEHIINNQIEGLQKAIEAEFKISKNTLGELLTFKKEIKKQESINNSIDYRKALIYEIQRLSESGELKSQLSDEQSILLADKLIALEKLKEKVQNGIDELRNEITNNTYHNELFSSQGLTLKWSKNICEKIDNPKGMGDTLIGFGVGVIETGVIVGKVIGETVVGIIKLPYDAFALMTSKAKLESNIKI